jgi:tRNA(fMet)-specific endonuclease VapC
MRRFLLDTKPAHDFNNNRFGIPERVDAERRKGNRIGICVPVLGELWSGVEGSSNRQGSLARLRIGVSKLIVWPFDVAAAEHFGRVFTELRRLGRPMQQIDIQIAAIAFALGNCTVVTADSDLSSVPGLVVENWS